MNRIKQKRHFYATVCGSLVVSACTTADYSDGINSFAQAVAQANTTEQALAASEQSVALSTYIRQSVGQNAVVDLGKCRGLSGSYKAGDCVVEIQQKSPPTAEPSSMSALMKYTALLSSVAADKTCSSLQTDATSLASAVGDMTKDAKQPGLANAAGPLTAIVSTIGCLAITNEQLSILREATKDANPIIQKLVPLIAKNNQDLYLNVLGDAVRQLDDATVSYNESKSLADLNKAVTLAKVVDNAQASQPGPLMAKLVTLHQSLTDDLAAPTVTLKSIESDAQAFSADAKNIEAAVGMLANPSAAVSASAKKSTS